MGLGKVFGKVAKVGLGAATGFATGGIPGAIAGGAKAALGKNGGGEGGEASAAPTTKTPVMSADLSKGVDEGGPSITERISRKPLIQPRTYSRSMRRG